MKEELIENYEQSKKRWIDEWGNSVRYQNDYGQFDLEGWYEDHDYPCYASWVLMNPCCISLRITIIPALCGPERHVATSIGLYNMASLCVICTRRFTEGSILHKS